MWIILLILGLAVVGGILAAMVFAKDEKAREEAMSQALAAIPDFSPTMKIIGIRHSYTFATDDEHHKILYLVNTETKLCNYEDIISVELIEDGSILTKKSAGRTIGGALLGGVVAGGVGAIVGGLSGSSTQQNLHSSVKVKVLLRNNPVPSFEISCYDCKTMDARMKPVNDYDSFYCQGKGDATTITDTLSVIIDAVDKEQSVQVQTNSSSAVSVADEIAKLADLKEKGLLTEEEFAVQKAKLLE